jgi:hypothetical protein
VVPVVLAVVATAVAGVGAAPFQAQAANEVTGLAVVQGDGFATVSWTPVEGATDYQIERTPVDVTNTPSGPSVITGVWRPNRQVNQGSPAFADAGFNPGERFQWRVRARFGTEPQDFSEPVFDTTLPPWGDPSVPGESLRTQWEQTLAAQFTSDVNEYAYTAALDAASERVRVVEIGQTVLGRPINMFVIGYPEPLATAEAIRNAPTAMVNCNVHGNEPSSREACLIMARELAFSNDARTIDLLSNVTVLIVPTVNGDGRANNTRGNSTGQDLNRDHSLLRQPETKALAAAIRDYTPDSAFDGHEFGNSNAGDLPTLPPRHQNVGQSIFDESQNMIVGWLYSHGSADGWWYCPYGCQGGGNVGLSEETILRNTLGLKNTTASLLEARSAGGPTRPNEGNAQNNRRRKTYSALYTYEQFLDYFWANQPAIDAAVKDAIAFQRSNTGRIVFRGSRPIPAFPAPHPGESPPPINAPTPDQILEDPPCGYFLTGEQYLGERPEGSVAERLALHGITVRHAPDRGHGAGYLVLMAQPLRGLIPLLLDGQAAEEMVAGVRLYPAPTPRANELPEETCGRGRRVSTVPLDVDVALTYDTD